MRIDSKVVVPISAGEARQAPSATKPPANTSSSTVVEISPAAAQAAAETDPKVTQRIAQIKEMLQAGAYPVDLEKLASRIVDDELLRGPP